MAAKRTTHRSSTGKKLYAVRDAKGRLAAAEFLLCWKIASQISKAPEKALYFDYSSRNTCEDPQYEKYAFEN